MFLIQIAGHRRWQIGTVCDDKTPLVEGTELQIIDKFEATDEWVLGPGDMLYLPPGVAHWGVARRRLHDFFIGFSFATIVGYVV